MRILYVTPSYKPAYRMGGPIASVAAAAETIVRKGHEVTVVTTNANLDTDIDVPLNRPLDVDGVTVWYFKREEPVKRWLRFVPYLSESVGFLYAPEMKNALRMLVPQFDVINTHMPFVYPTHAAARIALRNGKPLFYHQRGNFISSRLQRRRLKKDVYIALFEKPVMRRAAGLIALTEAERDAFRSIAPDTPCVIIPNGVDAPPPDPHAAARAEARWAIPRDAVVVLYFGRLQTWKGADELLKTFARVQAAHPELFLLMTGVDECDAQRRWRPIVDRDGYRHRVVFTGPLSGREKEDVLHRADLFSLPSAGEGLSMATLEAMAHATAVMLSPGCHFPEIEPAGAGIIVDRSVDAMVPALERLISDRQLLRTQGEAGRRMVMRNYSWDVIADRLLDFYSRGMRAA